MRYICDAPGGRTWFALDTEAEAEAEASLMQHAVDKYFHRALELARDTYVPRPGLAAFERDIGLKDHLTKSAPLFLTLRDGEGHGLATAMLPPLGRNQAHFRSIIVGPGNSDPYAAHADAIAVLAQHFGIELKREACYPYG